MSECVMLIDLAKTPALNFLDFSWPKIRLSAPPSTPQSLTIQALLPPPHWFSTKSSQYQY